MSSCRLGASAIPKTVSGESTMSAIVNLLRNVAFLSGEPSPLVVCHLPWEIRCLKVGATWHGRALEVALRADLASEKTMSLAAGCDEPCCDGEVECVKVKAHALV